MVTKDQLKSLFPRGKAEFVDSFAAQADELFDRFGIGKAPNRLHFFLAQIGHESGGLTIVEEMLNYSAKRLMEVFPSRFPTLASTSACAGNPEGFGCNVYGGRMGNAKLPSKDGFTYRGRGYIQLTGRDNYKMVGDKAGIDLVGSPDRAASAKDALLVACAFWESRDLNAIADSGDFTKVTRRINGGTVGLAERQNWLTKVRRTLADPPAKQPDALTVLAVQKALVQKGFKETGAPDGEIGRNTAAAIRNFRLKNGLPDGMIDDALLKALGLE